MGRSQIAEALLKQAKGDIFEVASAGTQLSGPEQPIGELAPAIDNVIAVMKEAEVAISKNIRKQITKEMIDSFDKIILVMDNRDLIPDYLVDNPKVIRWDVLDPKGQSLEFTRQIKDQIKDLISANF